MCDETFEKKSPLQRGSYFTSLPVHVPRHRPTKNIFTPPSDEFEIPIQRSRITTKNSDNTLEDQEVEKAFKLKPKVSLIKVGGHFSTLKKKHQADYNKFREEKSKSFELLQLESSIEKIQVKILELTKTIEAKSSAENSKQQTSCVFGKAFGRPKAKPIDWSQKKAIEALGIVVAIVLSLLVLFYVLDNKSFRKSIFGSSFKFRLFRSRPKSFLQKLLSL